ncbi:HNH endonuclease [Blautia marasmi]|uniref:HNH endonuclease n=1 Tax=Blautia marasmi TaxID=1917868 RepID=UPI00266C0DEE|nr:HNH endonuclease [Blautia marasmi]
MSEGIVLLADTVHHIVPLKDDWNKRSDISNLMSLNHDTHSMIEQMYKKDIVRTQSLLLKMLHGYRSM